MLWEEMLRSIPEVKSTIIFPLSNNIELCDELSKLLLEKKLKSYDEATKQLPGYLDALRSYIALRNLFFYSRKI